MTDSPISKNEDKIDDAVTPQFLSFYSLYFLAGYQIVMNNYYSLEGETIFSAFFAGVVMTLVLVVRLSLAGLATDAHVKSIDRVLVLKIRAFLGYVSRTVRDAPFRRYIGEVLRAPLLCLSRRSRQLYKA